MSVRIVGCMNEPLLPDRFPPKSTRAPWAMASLTCFSRSCKAASEESGPSVTLSSRGSPSFNSLVAFEKASRNFSFSRSTMMNRLAPTHIWPQLPKRPSTAIFTVCSRSASCRTTNASLPPSSMVDFLRFFPAREANASPARSDPVRAMPRVRGSSISTLTCSFERKRLVYVPAGSPASFRILSKARAHCGTPGACFSKITFPDIKFGATNLASW